MDIIGGGDVEDDEAGVRERPDLRRPHRLGWWTALVVAMAVALVAGPVAAAHITPWARSPGNGTYPLPGPPRLNPPDAPARASVPGSREAGVPGVTPTGENANQREGRGLDSAGCPTS